MNVQSTNSAQNPLDLSPPGLAARGIEIIRPLETSEPLRHALFDFDGTLSLVREGWIDIMVPMMVDELANTGTDESVSELTEVARTFVAELTGKQTIYQMIRLAEEIANRGGSPQEPVLYKHRYHDLLMQRSAARRQG
ncbi:MAG: hypothetical protein KDA99_28800, partial [Planctomycetales bacterium]|nr:hypothetical protein [Planctomycetales bacterium]